jgi:hypothetical protein
MRLESDGLASEASSAMVAQVKAEQLTSIKFCRGGGSLSGLLLVAGLLGCFPGSGRATEPLPAASEVTRRMLERAQAVARADQSPQYTYEKRSLLEHLDSAGQAFKTEEKIYQVTLINGFPFNRLVKIPGRELSAEELKREDAREERFRQRFISADEKKMVARKEPMVTPELLDRYQFVVKERVVLSNRPTLVLTFKPKAGDLPSKSVQDKLLNQMGGTLWIDEGDGDTARLAVNLVEPVSLGWFGWLGSLTRCELTLDRQRMPDGVWINTTQALFIQCRKLATTLRFRTTEESRGLRRQQARP